MPVDPDHLKCERLRPDDLDSRRQIAQLHLELLPDSLLSLLGLAVVERYYRLLATSETENVFFCRVRERVLGAAVLSTAPDTLMGRVLKHDLVVIAWRAMVRAMRSVKVARRLIRGCWYSKPPAAVRSIPEVVQIFVCADDRGQGIGRRMLGEVESHLRSESCSSYFVKTLPTSENRALGFYGQLGFVGVAEQRVQGVRFQFLKKELPRE